MSIRRIVIDDDTVLDVSVIPVDLLRTEMDRAVKQLIRAADHLQAIAESLTHHGADVDAETLGFLIAGGSIAVHRGDKAIKRGTFIRGTATTRLTVAVGLLPEGVARIKDAPTDD